MPVVKVGQGRKVRSHLWRRGVRNFVRCVKGDRTGDGGMEGWLLALDGNEDWMLKI